MATEVTIKRDDKQALVNCYATMQRSMLTVMNACMKASKLVEDEAELQNLRCIAGDLSTDMLWIVGKYSKLVKGQMNL